MSRVHSRHFALILGFSALLLLSLLVNNTAAQSVEVSLVTTNDVYYGLTWNYQRGTVYAKGRHWIFYWQNAGQTLKYISSVTGTGDWGNEGTIDTTVHYSYFCVWYDSARDLLHLAYTRHDGTRWAYLHYRSAIPNSDGTLTLGARYNAHYESSQEARHLFICVDTNGRPYIAFQRTDGTYYRAWLTRSSTNDGTWSTVSGWPKEVGSHASGALRLVPLPNNYVYMIYSKPSNFAPRTRLYGAYTDGSSITSDGYIGALSYTYDLWAEGNMLGSHLTSMVSDSAGNVHLAFRVAEDAEGLTAGTLYYRKRTGYPSGSWSSAQVIQTGTYSQHPYYGGYGAAPVLSLLPDGRLVCFWIGLSSAPSCVYFKVRSAAGVWDTDPTLVSDESAEGFYNEYARGRCTGFFYATSDYKVGFCYTTKTSSPYNVKYALLDFSPTTTVTSTVTSFSYASSTARTTSTTTTTQLISTTSTRSTTTSATSTAPPVTSTIQSPTTAFSTTPTTMASSTTTTAHTTTTTTYAGPSSTTTILTTAAVTATTATSITTLSSTTTTTTATSSATSYATTGTTTSYSTASSTVLTGTDYAYSTTTIGAAVATTKTTTIGTTTTTQIGAPNTVLIIYTEQRNVVTTYTQSVRATQSVLGRLDFDILRTQIVKLVEASFASFFELIQDTLTDIVTFFESVSFNVLEETHVYAPADIQITINSNPQGSGLILVNGASVTTPYSFFAKWGDTIQLEALSPVDDPVCAGKKRYTFISWSDDGGQSHPYFVQDLYPIEITADYRTEYNLQVYPYPEGLQNWLKIGGVLYSSYETEWVTLPHAITIEAVEPIDYLGDEYRFKEWGLEVGGIRTDNPLDVSVEALSIQARYSRQYQLTISTNPSGLSSTNPLPGIYWYDEGTVVTVTAQPAAGLTFRYWKVDGSSQGDGVAQIQVYMTTHHTAIAHYMYEKGEVSQPSVTFYFTTPVATPLVAVLFLALAVIASRKIRTNSKQ